MTDNANTRTRRWTFYVLLIWAGVLLVSMILLVPETYHPVYVCPDPGARATKMLKLVLDY